MLKLYIQTTEAFKRMASNEDGVVSFEYVIVAACIVAAVSAAFGTANGAGISSVLKTAITAIGTAVSTAVTPPAA